MRIISCLAVAAAVMIVFSESLLPENTGLFGEAEAVLKDVPWQECRGETFVRFGLKNRSAESDLALQCRYLISGGKLWLQALVEDERLVFKEGLVSDHVELWICDPRYLKDYRKLERGLNGDDLEELENWEGKFANTVKSAMRRELQKLLREPPATQFVFAHDITFSIPAEAGPRARCDYREIYGGYEFAAVVELSGALHLKRGFLESLLVLVDAVDADDPGATAQESLVSNSERRRFGIPETFQALTLAKREQVVSNAAIALFESSGHWHLTASGYRFYLAGTIALSGDFGMERTVIPGYWQELRPALLLDENNLRLTAWEKSLLAEIGGEAVLISMEKLIGASGGYKYRLLFNSYHRGIRYLLLDIAGASRYPQGSTYCGAGEEINLIWLKLNDKFQVLDSSSLLYESCLLSREASPLGILPDRVRVDYCDFSEGDNDSFAYEFIFQEPDKGIQKIEKPEKK